MPRKCAVTVLSEFMVTAQTLFDTLSHPSQPMKIEPNAGLALNVTVVPITYRCSQSLPHWIPDGRDVTAPLPVPPLVTVSVE